VSQLESGPLTQSEGEVGQKEIGAVSWSACRKSINFNILTECILVNKIVINLYHIVIGDMNAHNTGLHQLEFGFEVNGLGLCCVMHSQERIVHGLGAWTIKINYKMSKKL
jgi:hypothetical protein